MARIQSLGSAIRPLDLYGAPIPQAWLSKLEQDEHPTICLVSCGGILVYEVSKTNVYVYAMVTIRIHVHDIKLSR